MSTGRVGSNIGRRSPMAVEGTAAERRRALSGDVFVCTAAGAVMHAMTIAAPPDSVWRWLVQMGAGRAGWYSYDWIDNDGRPRATKIVPQLIPGAMFGPG